MRGKAGQQTMIYTYILKSLKDKGYYVGITKNINERLEKHNKGGVISTKNRKPFKLVKYESFNNYLQARNREKEIKAYKGGVKFKELVK